MTPSSLTVLRVAGFFAWAMIGLETFLRVEPAPPPQLGAAAARVVLAVSLALYAAFGAAFWWNTRRIQGRPPARASVALLVLQVLLALMVSTPSWACATARAPGCAPWSWAGSDGRAAA
jgi:hypothetical protein